LTLIDITRPITPELAVWPGDTPYRSKPVLQIANGHAVNLSTLTLSAHTGTHADAPYHFLEEGATIDRVPLDAYVGPATVVDLRAVRGAIRPEHLEGVDLDKIERLLIRTHASDLPHDQWTDEIAYPAPETARLLGKRGLKLFGTDAPSVDPVDSKALAAHKALWEGGVVNLEGLWLRDVPPGRYELIALPLKLDGDGSPVRAVLRVLSL